MEKVKVRIAVAVDESGAWNSCGWGGPASTAGDGEMMALAVDPLGSPEARYWIEVEIDLPTVGTVQGSATEATA